MRELTFSPDSSIFERPNGRTPLAASSKEIERRARLREIHDSLIDSANLCLLYRLAEGELTAAEIAGFLGVHRGTAGRRLRKVFDDFRQRFLRRMAQMVAELSGRHRHWALCPYQLRAVSVPPQPQWAHQLKSHPNLEDIDELSMVLDELMQRVVGARHAVFVYGESNGAEGSALGLIWRVSNDEASLARNKVS